MCRFKSEDMVFHVFDAKLSIFIFFPVNYLKPQWKNLKDNLRRCMIKRAQMSKSGAAAHTLPKCKYFSQLQFLHKKVINKETESNVRNDFIHQETLTNPPELSLPTTSHLQSPTNQEATSPSICFQPPSKSKRRNTLYILYYIILYTLNTLNITYGLGFFEWLSFF